MLSPGPASVAPADLPRSKLGPSCTLALPLDPSRPGPLGSDTVDRGSCGAPAASFSYATLGFDCPPSTVSTVPVVKLAAVLARYRAAPTISSGSPARPLA